MLPDSSIHSGWTSTDDGEPVAVRVGRTTASQPSAPAAYGPVMHTAPHAGPQSDIGLQLSAFAGIAIVLLGLGLVFGIGSLSGDLTGSGSTTTDPVTPTITVTADGQFSPVSITLKPGGSLALLNKNKDPQVLKSKTGRELFPVQVLFDKTVTVLVPADATGTYTYFSETLPDDRTFTITIAGSQSGSATNVVQKPATQVPEVPIPFGSPAQPPSVAQPTGDGAASASSTAVVTQHSTDTATISLQPENSQPTETKSDFSKNQLPTNPYTVAAGKMNGSRPTIGQIAASQQLHSGAPPRAFANAVAPPIYRTPRTVTKTGAGTWLVVTIGILAMAVTVRRGLARA